MKTKTMIFKNERRYCPGLLFVTSIFFPSAQLIAGVVEQSSKHSTMDSSVWVLPAEQWEAGQDGNFIVQIPVLKSFMQSWIERYDINHGLRIELQYPGGEEGELWVQELADWLVTMGVPSKYIFMVPGSGTADKIKLTLVR